MVGHDDMEHGRKVWTSAQDVLETDIDPHPPTTLSQVKPSSTLSSQGAHFHFQACCIRLPLRRAVSTQLGYPQSAQIEQESCER